MLKSLQAIAASVCLCLSPAVDSSEDIDAMKSAYIYYFSKFIIWQDWSEGLDLVICAINPETSFAKQLTKVAGKKFGAGEIRIEIMNKETGYAIDGCNALFVSQGSQTPPNLVDKVRAQKNLLVVKEQGENLVPATIQFVLNGSRLGFTVDTREAARQGLVISAKLLQLATRVDGGT